VLPGSLIDHARSSRLEANPGITVPAYLAAEGDPDGKAVPHRPEVARLAESIDARSRAFVDAAAYLGLRWGELAGIKRTSLDIAVQRVRIVGSLERVDNDCRYVEELGSPRRRPSRHAA
jgi:hypothetical protein